MNNKIPIIFFIFILVLIPVLSVLSYDNSGVNIKKRHISRQIEIGRQYLLIIAIDKYKYWKPLLHPVNDAKEIRDILVTRYYIDNVIELYDEEATKVNIIKVFERLQNELDTDDSLLIFFAGHGHLDKVTNSGFWIPVNAGTDRYEQLNWLPNTLIRGLISGFKASHICLISDSCFSGDILDIKRSGTPELTKEYFRKSFSRTSRQVITSGADEIVPDASEFAMQLKMVLRKNKMAYLDPFFIFNEIRLGVKSTMPLIGSLSNTGHQEGALFILFLNKQEGANEIDDHVGYSNVNKEENISFIPDIENKNEFYKSGNIDYFYSAGTSLCITFPAGDEALKLEDGFMPSVFWGINFNLSWGIIGLQINTGLNLQNTREGVSSPYTLYSIPLTFSISYLTNIFLPLFAFTEINTGCAFNVVDYDEGKGADYDNVNSTRFTLLFSAGFGYYFNKQVSIYLAGKIMMIFMSENIYSSFLPGTGISYRL